VVGEHGVTRMRTSEGGQCVPYNKRRPRPTMSRHPGVMRGNVVGLGGRGADVGWRSPCTVSGRSRKPW
jgi:hypothetical protein